MKLELLMNESSRLRAEATTLLRKHSLLKRLGEYGEVLLTGSFAADLMTSGDVDIYVIGKWNKSDVRSVFESLLDEIDVKAWQLFNWVKYHDPRFPKAWYIGIRDVYRGRKWKIDIWFLNKKQVERIPFSRWGEINVSENQRAAIIAFKNYRDQKQLEIPSYRIYEAVLHHDMRTVKSIREYCSKFEI